MINPSYPIALLQRPCIEAVSCLEGRSPPRRMEGDMALYGQPEESSDECIASWISNGSFRQTKPNANTRVISPDSWMVSPWQAALAFACLLAVCASAPHPGPKVYSYQILGEFPHDHHAFTQGKSEKVS